MQQRGQGQRLYVAPPAAERLCVAQPAAERLRSSGAAERLRVGRGAAAGGALLNFPIPGLSPGVLIWLFDFLCLF